MSRARAVFLSHGGGPLPLLGDAGHREMVTVLQTLAASLDKPSAVLLISAHWEMPIATLTAAQQPSLLYDYYGFPEASYHIQYPATGDPGLASTVFDLLSKSGITAELDEQRGFDHGMFIPMKIMYPDADLPCVQLSLLSGLDPQAHIALGQALSGLTHPGLLLIGSGFSFHNLRAFFSAGVGEIDQGNEVFDAWLVDTCTDKSLTEAERATRLREWEIAPYARYCHPREEHLLPLHVCYGYAGRACSEFIQLRIMNKKASIFIW